MTKPFVVTKGEGGMTLLSFLKERLKGQISGKAIKRAIDGKLCQINGETEWFSTHKLQPDDEITIDLEVGSVEPLGEPLYEDDDYVIYNKPPGRTTESFAPLLLVHRLDKDTSGALILAKSEKAQKAIFSHFSERRVKKEYLAIVDGTIQKTEWRVENHLAKKISYEGGGIWGVVSSSKGKYALTEFSLIEAGESASLILARPITGRTHQIRIHLQGVRHPVLGDGIYGRKVRCPYRPKRQLLHASKISFMHPLKKKEVAIVAPLFSDFIEAKKILFGS